jgi:hypothetical protein
VSSDVVEADWDPYDANVLADPPASWAELRERCPVARVERMGGFWAVSRYDDVVEIARDSARFNNSGGPQFGTSRPPLEVDRPEHTFFRRILQPYFAGDRVATLEPRVRGFVVEMLEPLLAAGGGDLAGALSYPLPARTLCLWLGLPDGEWSYLKAISEELFEAEEGLAGREDVLSPALAHGLKQGLELAAAVAMRPEILLLDEPTAGLTSNEREVIGDVFRRLVGAGMTIVLIEHDLDFVARVADRVIVLHGGKVVESGTPDEVSQSSVVREAYVGSAAT